MNVNLDARQTAMVLAALRYWQVDVASYNPPDFPMKEHFTEAAPLSNEEIDELCEAINCDPDPATIAALPSPRETRYKLALRRIMRMAAAGGDPYRRIDKMGLLALKSLNPIPPHNPTADAIQGCPACQNLRRALALVLAQSENNRPLSDQVDEMAALARQALGLSAPHRAPSICPGCGRSDPAHNAAHCQNPIPSWSCTITLSKDEYLLIINALEILSPDSPEDTEKLHELFCRLDGLAPHPDTPL